MYWWEGKFRLFNDQKRKAAKLLVIMSNNFELYEWIKD